MDASESTDFYEYLPVFRDFTNVADEACFTPMPGDWVVGVADVQQSTEAIRQNRYKAVNMAGAAVIASVANALKNRDFPFVFGGDGASFAVPSADAALARQALAETATWVKEDLDLNLRIGMVSVADIRARGNDVRVARYVPSDNISIAMFSGGGLAWADAAMKRGDIAVPAAPSGAHPDLSGLSCRYELIPAQRGQIFCLSSFQDQMRAVPISAPSSRPSHASSKRRLMRHVPSPTRACASGGRRKGTILRRARRVASVNWSVRARSRSWP